MQEQETPSFIISQDQLHLHKKHEKYSVDTDILRDLLPSAAGDELHKTLESGEYSRRSTLQAARRVVQKLKQHGFDVLKDAAVVLEVSFALKQY